MTHLDFKQKQGKQEVPYWHESAEVVSEEDSGDYITEDSGILAEGGLYWMGDYKKKLPIGVENFEELRHEKFK